MTYFGFLALFLGLPLLVLSFLTLRDMRRGSSLPQAFGNISPWIALSIHVVLALIYTTPWDNYLVATGVWYYDPALVTGLRLGWVPIEEYTFFVVQTLLTGLWLLFLARHLSLAVSVKERVWKPFNWPAAVLVILWFGSVALLASGWRPGIYLGLILVWAIPPILIQLVFGADLLWQRRRLVTLTLLSATLYLAVVDSLAIGSGTWTIAPEQSLNIYLGGMLPIEELLFFLVTNTLIVFGMTLLLAPESRSRFHLILQRMKQAPSTQITE